jgi:beta-mannosidase
MVCYIQIGLFSGDKLTNTVWHGEMAPYQDYKRFTSRFVSEFGFESCPDIRTLHKAITAPNERHAQSRMFDIHDKGPVSEFHAI